HHTYHKYKQLYKTSHFLFFYQAWRDFFRSFDNQPYRHTCEFFAYHQKKYKKNCCLTHTTTTVSPLINKAKKRSAGTKKRFLTLKFNYFNIFCSYMCFLL